MQFYLMENQETIVEANLKVSNTSSKIIGQYIVEGWRIEDFYDVESNIWHYNEKSYCVPYTEPIRYNFCDSPTYFSNEFYKSIDNVFKWRI